MADASKVIDYDFTRSTLAAAALVGPTLSFTRTSEARHFDSAGVLQTAASGTARLASHVYDGSAWVNKGYLVEEQRINKCLQSEDVTTTWTNISSAVLTANDAVAPDGATTMDKVEDTSAVAASGCRQDVGIVNDSTSHTFSCFMLKTSGASYFSNLKHRMVNGTTTKDGDCVFNPNTGEITATSADVASSSSEDLGDFIRISCTVTNNSTGNTLARLQLQPAWNTDGTTTPSNAAQGANHFWGMQHEIGSFPTSYIPTTTVAVTRNADQLTDTTGISAIFNTNAGTAVVQYRKFGELTNSAYVYSLDDGTDSDRWHMLHSNTGADIRSFINGGAGASNGDVSQGTVVLDTDVEAASAFAENDLNLAVDGTLGTQDTAVSVFSAVDEIAMGIDNVGKNQHLNGFIKTFAYFDERKSDAFLQSPDLARGGGGTAIFASELL